MAGVSLRNINKTYPNGVKAVKNFSLEIADKEFVVIVGPSGCGKSTTLRMIAGLEDISSGELYIGERLVNGIPARDRDIAMVFQNYALYPHLNVFENMAFGLRTRKVKKDEITRLVTETAASLGIGHLLKRRPKTLSGGECQRVAIGRAIIREPKVFLMDEPLSNLDAKLRVQMRTEIANLYEKIETTFVYVTHDQVEAMTLGSRIVVMDGGVIQQVDTPRNIYNHPANLFVAGFIGSPQMNFIEAAVIKHNDALYLERGETRFSLTPEHSTILADKGYAGRNVILGIRPKDITLGGDSTKASVNRVENLGTDVLLYLTIEGVPCVAILDSDTDAKHGDVVSVRLDLAKAHLFDGDTGEALQ